MLYCKYCEIFKNSFFCKTPLVAASAFILKLKNTSISSFDVFRVIFLVIKKDFSKAFSFRFSKEKVD